MTQGGAEAFKAAIRRSIPLIVGIIVLGIVAVNAFTQLRGPRYEAEARVLVPATTLSSIITKTQPGFVDPQRVQETAVGIAKSHEVYTLAAKQTDGKYGDADELAAAVEVTPDPSSDLITFTASDPNADDAVAVTNAVAHAYIRFRNTLAGQQVKRTITDLTRNLETLPSGSLEANDLRSQLARLEVLPGNASGDQVIEEATSADKVSPAPLKDSLLGLSLGLIVALLLVALREAIDTTVRSEADVEELLSAPILGSVGSLPRRTKIVSYGRHEPLFADAYALLSAQLVHADGHVGSQVIAITSSVAREGKTTTAANLAIAAARRGSNVILADFDFRQPALGELFGLPAKTEGALQVLSGDATVSETLRAVSLEGASPTVSSNGSLKDETGSERESSRRSLRLLASGGAISSGRLPQRKRLASLLRALRDSADLVILDTPPALITVEIAELSEFIDAVVVVVRQGRATQRNLRALHRQARAWPTKVAGAVLTDVKASAEYDYGYRSH
jgi:Mrp family chromosome partitioning ATPase/capsular polysaccharide biosynthesis protein